MAVDIMAHPEQLHSKEAPFDSPKGGKNKGVWINFLLFGEGWGTAFLPLGVRGLLFASILGVSYSLLPASSPNVPAVWVKADESGFRTRKGITYLHQKPFSGWQYALSPEGDTLLSIPYWQGKMHGWAKAWYPNGKMQTKRYYQAGKQIGKHEGWWADGKPKFIYHFEADVYEGLCQEWHENGRLMHIGHYHQGQEEGRQTFWRADGSLHANYVAKGGRNYGLTGVKNCSPLTPKGGTTTQ